jgi:uncharacterized protein (DUF927 family)
MNKTTSLTDLFNRDSERMAQELMAKTGAKTLNSAIFSIKVDAWRNVLFSKGEAPVDIGNHLQN